MIRRIALVLAFLAPSLAQAQPIGSLPEETTFSDLFEVAIWDPSETNPFDATKRMSLSLLLSGAGSALSVTDGVTIVGDTALLTFAGATVADSGGGNATVTILGGGGGSFLSLSDTPNAFAASQCLAADGAGTALQFQACVTGGGADGVIESIGFTGRSVSIGRSIGADVTGTLPADAYDDRVSTWAHTSNPTGMVPPSRLGTGIKNDMTFLRGDSTYAAPPTLTAGTTSGLLISGSAISFSPQRLSRLGSEDISRSDDLVLKNESDANFPTLISIQSFLEDIAGDNLAVDSNNRQLNAVPTRLSLFEEGIELTNDLHGINFRGFEVVVLDTPQGIANIRFGSILQDEGSELSEDGAHIVNYTGAGITASFG